MGKRGPLPKNKLPATDNYCSPVKPTKEDIERQRRYRAEDALRTLNQAEEVRSNKQLMSDVKDLAQEQMSSLKRFAK